MPIQNMQSQRDPSDDDMDDDRDEFDNNAGQGNVGQGNVSQGNVGQPNPGQGNYQGNPGQNLNDQDNGGEFAQPQQGNPGSELGSGPQPVIDGMPAEVALNPEASEGSPNRERNFNGGNGHGGEAREGRRNRRPRRGERSRPDVNDDGEPAADGLVATLSRGAPVSSQEPKAQEPVADAQGDGDTAVIDRDS
jgi:hypothetical protein